MLENEKEREIERKTERGYRAPLPILLSLEGVICLSPTVWLWFLHARAT
jgi:hypothetical protein